MLTKTVDIFVVASTLSTLQWPTDCPHTYDLLCTNAINLGGTHDRDTRQNCSTLICLAYSWHSRSQICRRTIKTTPSQPAGIEMERYLNTTELSVAGKSRIPWQKNLDQPQTTIAR